MPAKVATTVTAVLGFALAIADAAADHPALAFGSEAAGAINTLPAEPMPKGGWGLGIRSEIIENKPFSDEQLEGFAEQAREGVHSVDRITTTSMSIAYGVSADLTILARLPYIKRTSIREGEIEDGGPEVHLHGDSSGLGDLSLLGQYRFLQHNEIQAAMLAGLKAPTGRSDVKDGDGVRFGTEFQPGTGSWDVLLGAAATRAVGDVDLHASVLYNKTTEGSQSTRIGDAWSYSVGLSRRLKGEDHAEHHHAHQRPSRRNHHLSADLLLEVHGETRRATRVSGNADVHSGGTTVYLSPGIKIGSGKGFGGFLSVGIPVVKDRNGEQTETDNRIVAGISMAL